MSGDTLYPAIADHGLIGDMQTAAIVATDGTIDFLCLPKFDSPTVFARLLDAERGGFFRVEALMPEARREQRYLRDTNVLLTRFIGATAELELADFMPVERGRSPSKIVRLARVRRGTATVRCVCAPRFDYARASHELALANGAGTFTATAGTGLRRTTSA